MLNLQKTKLQGTRLLPNIPLYAYWTVVSAKYFMSTLNK